VSQATIAMTNGTASTDWHAVTSTE